MPFYNQDGKSGSNQMVRAWYYLVFMKRKFKENAELQKCIYSEGL